MVKKQITQEVKEHIKEEVKEVKKEKSCKFNNFYKFLIVVTLIIVLIILLLTLFQIKEGERYTGKTITLSDNIFSSILFMNSIKEYESGEVISYKCDDNIDVYTYIIINPGSMDFSIKYGKGSCGLIIKQKYHYIAWK